MATCNPLEEIIHHDLGVHTQEWLSAMNRNDTNWRDYNEEQIIERLKRLDKIGSSDPCHVERQSVEHDLCCVFVTQDTDPKNTKCINVYRDGRIEEYFP